MNVFDVIVKLFLPVSILAGSLLIARSARRGSATSKASADYGSFGADFMTIQARFSTLEEAEECFCRLFDRETNRIEPAPVEDDRWQPGAVDEEPYRFFIDSLVLLECFRHVCALDRPLPERDRHGRADFHEKFHYATGVKVDPSTFVINRIVPVAFSEQTTGGVTVMHSSNIAALESLDRLGLPLIGHVHSHPGWCADGTSPSNLDREFQRTLEAGGHTCLGIIFTRDGFCRFWAGDATPFVVHVQGHHVKEVDHNVYRLTVANGTVHVRPVVR